MYAERRALIVIFIGVLALLLISLYQSRENERLRHDRDYWKAAAIEADSLLTAYLDGKEM